jgi:hypothetical protein
VTIPDTSNNNNRKKKTLTKMSNATNEIHQLRLVHYTIQTETTQKKQNSVKLFKIHTFKGCETKNKLKLFWHSWSISLIFTSSSLFKLTCKFFFSLVTRSFFLSSGVVFLLPKQSTQMVKRKKNT